MERIHILPDVVVDQIAAGEVVERPASVIKELLENSLDAGASQLRIAIEAGGTRRMEVIDDGAGLHPEDLKLALLRGATSKLKAIEDLHTLRSLGFRGEALASIASVSRLTLATRRASDLEGCQLVAHGAAVVSLGPCGVPPGTRVCVEDLFFNVPARRHFLKKEATEAAHVQHVARQYAICYPAVSFTFIQGRKTLWHAAGCGTLSERLVQLWGQAWVAGLRPVQASAYDLQLAGFVGKSTAAARGEEVLWLNGRPIEPFMVRKVLRLMGLNGVPFFLNLKIDPSLVDVNVHPTKREVRFREEAQLLQFLQQSLQQESVFKPAVDLLAIPLGKSDFFRKQEPVYSVAEPTLALAPKHVPSAPKALRDPMDPRPSSSLAPPSSQRAATASWTFIGVLQRGAYALWESDQGLVILDTQEAWGRVYLEALKAQTATQALVLPEMLHLEPLLSAKLQGLLEDFAKSGFIIEAFGRDTVRIRCVPAWLEGSAAVFLKNCLVRLEQEPALPLALCLAQVGALGARTPDAQACWQLLEKLFKTQTPGQGATGRSVFWVLKPPFRAF